MVGRWTVAGATLVAALALLLLLVVLPVLVLPAGPGVGCAERAGPQEFWRAGIQRVAHPDRLQLGCGEAIRRRWQLTRNSTRPGAVGLRRMRPWLSTATDVQAVGSVDGPCARYRSTPHLHRDACDRAEALCAYGGQHALP